MSVMSHGAWQRVRMAAQVLVAAGAMGYVLTRADWRAVGEQFKILRPVWLAALVPLVTIRVASSAYRWRLFIPSTVSFTTLLRLYLIGFFFNAFLPTNVGGDIMKGALLRRHLRVSLVTGLVSSAADRFAGILALVLVAAAAAAMWPRLAAESGVGLPLLLLAVLCAAGVAMVFVRSCRMACVRVAGVRGLRFLQPVASQICALAGTYGAMRRLLTRAIMWSLLIQILDVTVVYVLARLANVPVGYATIAVVSPLVAAAGLLPISINGIGVMEGATWWLYTRAGVREQDAITLALTMRVFLVIIAVAGGGAYLWDVFFVSRREEKGYAEMY